MGNEEKVGVDEEDKELEREFRLTGLFMDNAKSYIQLSTGALFLSITFLHEVLGVKTDKIPLDRALLTSWICFLLAIVAGVYYQYLAVKFLEVKSKVKRHPPPWPRWLINHPWPMYLFMMLSFYGGAIFFTWSAIDRLRYLR